MGIPRCKTKFFPFGNVIPISDPTSTFEVLKSVRFKPQLSLLLYLTVEAVIEGIV